MLERPARGAARRRSAPASAPKMRRALPRLPTRSLRHKPFGSRAAGGVIKLTTPRRLYAPYSCWQPWLRAVFKTSCALYAYSFLRIPPAALMQRGRCCRVLAEGAFTSASAGGLCSLGALCVQHTHRGLTAAPNFNCPKATHRSSFSLTAARVKFDTPGSRHAL